MKDIAVKDDSDIRLKIRKNFAFKNMETQEVKGILGQNSIITSQIPIK